MDPSAGVGDLSMGIKVLDLSLDGPDPVAGVLSLGLNGPSLGRRGSEHGD